MGLTSGRDLCHGILVLRTTRQDSTVSSQDLSKVQFPAVLHSQHLLGRHIRGIRRMLLFWKCLVKCCDCQILSDLRHVTYLECLSRLACLVLTSSLTYIGQPE